MSIQNVVFKANPKRNGMSLMENKNKKKMEISISFLCMNNS